MAQPQPKPSDWQIANAQELQVTDKQVLAMLRAAKKRVDSILADLPAGKQEIRRAQLESTRARLLAEQADIFDRLGDIVSARRARAASRSAGLSAAADRALLDAVGKGAQGQFLYESALQVGQRQIDAALARMRLSQLPLSKRIYNTSVWMQGRLGKFINETLATGLNAQEFAKRARDWFNPNTPGGVRYAAMRLARTEINNAFHAMTAEKAARDPWIKEVDWNLSKSHPKPDICNTVHAESPFPADKVPARPHPQCMCYITPKAIEEDEFIDRFIAGEYDDFLDKELADAGWKPTEEPKQAPQPKPQVIIAQPVPVLKPTFTGQDAIDSIPKGLFKRGSMTPHQREALKIYEGGWFSVINGALRDDNRWDDPLYEKEIRDIGRIDSAMEGSVLPNDIQVWRGLFGAHKLFGKERFEHDLTGFGWEEKAYTSTTANERITEMFNAGEKNAFGVIEPENPRFKGQNVKMVISVPAGVQALATSDFEKGSKANGPQAEITLQRGLKFTVVKDNGVDENGVRVIEVRADRIGQQAERAGTDAQPTERELQPASPESAQQPFSPSPQPGQPSPVGDNSFWDDLAQKLDEAKKNPPARPVKKPRVKPVERPDESKLTDRARVEGPAEESEAVRKIGYKISDKISKKIQAKIKRVAGIHEQHIGDRISRIGAIESGIPRDAGVKVQNTFAVAYYDSGTIHLHSKFGDKGAVMAGCAHSHWFIHGGDDAHEDVLAHEFGHVFLSRDRLNVNAINAFIRLIQNQLDLPNRATILSQNRGAALRMLENLIRSPKNQETINEKVSQYARSNANEFFAEIWCGYTMNPNPPEHIKAIGDLMKQFITQERSGLSALSY